MSEMFNNYNKKYKIIPDNQENGPNNRSKKLFTSEFKDSIVIGADNEHSFDIPYRFDEINYLRITYKQGTDIRLNYKFCITDFIPANTDESGDNIYQYVWKYNPRVWLYIFSDNEIQTQIKTLQELKLNNTSIAYCALHYPINVEDSLKFNDYNNNVFVQLKACLNPDDDDPEDIYEYSDVYKIELISTILENEPIGGDN